MADNFRPNAGIVVFNKEGKVLLCKRSDEDDEWQFPQGGIEKGMTPAETALKEGHEELGVPEDAFQIIKVLKAKNEYEFDPIPARYKNKFRGQSQTFVLLRFLGKDEDISLTRYDQEFTQWRWCTIEEVRKMAEPKRLVGYEKAFKELGV